jgi:hypothetical protein
VRYDIFLTHIGNDSLPTAFVMMNVIQQMSPVPMMNISDARMWLTHTPLLLRRGVDVQEAHTLQRRFEQCGATMTILPSRLFFPEDTQGITRWRNEWFSEHLVALHESVLEDWARDTHVMEAYRFSYLPSLGLDLTIRLWCEGETCFGIARRSIGRIGPLPGPPGQDILWSPSVTDWTRLCDALQTHHFWNSESWDTVPDGYVVLDSAHWVVEGWRDRRYHVLVDQTPDEGAAREVGVLLFELLPDEFKQPQAE